MAKFDLDNYNKKLWFIDYAKITDIDNLPGEAWKDIGVIDDVDFTGCYQESNFGRTKSISRYIKAGAGKRLLEDKILKTIKEKAGYYSVTLCKDGKMYRKKVHRLVGFAFVENDDIEHKTCINHKDENKLNNRADNLEWCTQEYNISYGTARKRQSETMKKKYASGEIVANPPHIKKTVIQTDLEGNYIKTWDGAIDTEQEGYNSSSVNSCCKGRVLTHKNCFWMYEKDFTPENIKSKIEKLQNITIIPKAVVQLKPDGTLIKIWDRALSAKSFGFDTSCIIRCCIGERKAHYGYKWMYLSDYEKLNS